MERARCLPQINAIKFLGNPAGKMFERQTKATVEVKTRHFVTTLEGEKQRYSRLTRYLCFFSHGTLSICRDNLFLSSYMPCSVHFVGNRLLTNDILRLVISILFVSLVVAVESALKRHSFLELKIIHATQRGIVTFLLWYQETLFLNLPFFLKPIKDVQQHTVFPSCAKYLYITE